VRILKEKGITLIEMIVIIVVIGIAIPVLMRMWADLALRSTDSEVIADSTFLAGGLMEEIKSKKFVDPQEPSNTLLGPNSGEVYPAFDDVDDYNNFTDTPQPSYKRQVWVSYSSLDGASAWKPVGTPTDYKYIKVNVSRTDNLSSNIFLSTIVSKAQK
jgi:MSHA pilin protein MshD